MEKIIPQNLIDGANNNSFFNRGDGLERDAQNENRRFEACSYIRDLFNRLGGWNEKQAEILDERAAGWRELVREQYTAQAAFNANNVPWFIAGPANYPAARYNKRLEAAENKFRDYDEKKERYIKNTVDMLEKATEPDLQVKIWREGRQGYGRTIYAEDPLAVEKMEAHLQFLEERHAWQVRANAWIRKHGTAKGFEGISDERAAKIDADISGQQFRRCNYFFTDQDQANIRNKRARLEELKNARDMAEKANAEGTDGATMEKEGLKMVNNHEAARVQLEFAGVPGPDEREKLKRNGFRWSPRFKAWQRQNTPQALEIARMFFDAWDGEKFGEIASWRVRK